MVANERSDPGGVDDLAATLHDLRDHPVRETIGVRSRAGRDDEVVAPGLPTITLEEVRDGASLEADLGIIEQLGEGGMGRVLLARQRSLRRDVAVKTLHGGALAEHAMHALLREARVTGSLAHPGVIPVHSLGLDARGRPLLVMKRVDGVELEALLRDRAHPGWRARGLDDDTLVASLQILTQVCLTLEFAHSQGIVHRDVKPANIMVGAFGEVYLLDWGVARMPDDADDESVVGTPAYMAPEMARRGKVDARTDVYLLGATLHEVLTGRARHMGETVGEVIRAARRSRPVEYGHDVPEELARLCNEATALDPTERPQTVEAFRARLATYVRHRAAHALRGTAAERLEALESLLASSDEPPADLTLAYQLGTEARFGFAQCAREHGDDPVARDGLDRSVRALVELELRQGHADTAAALLTDLGGPDDGLRARLDRLRAELEDRERERERLEALEREHDPAHESSRRSLYFLVFVAIIIAAWTLTARTESRPPPHRLVWLSFGGLALSGLTVLAIRRRVLTNAFNRKIAALLVLSLCAMLVNRTLGWMTHTPVASTLAVDLLALAVMVGAAAITLTPRLFVPVTVLVLGAIALRLEWPSHIVGGFVLTVVVAVSSSLWAFHGVSRPPAPRD